MFIIQKSLFLDSKKMQNLDSNSSSISLPVGCETQPAVAKITAENFSADKITLVGVERFLSSSYVKGIGKVYASRIAQNVGKDILRSDFDFDKGLKEIPGLGESKIIAIKESLQKLPFSAEVLAFLYSCNLSDVEVDKIANHYKNNLLRVIEEDPYQMVEEVFKLSFFTADKIGRFLGISKEDLRRLQGALLTAVKIYAENGSLFAKEDEAVTTAARISGVDKKAVEHEIDNVVLDERLVRSHGGLYLPVYYKAEREGALKLADIIKFPKQAQTEFPMPKTDRMGNPLSPLQIEAIKTVAENPITVITGGPGTGKTTTVRGIIKLLEDCDKKFILAAPTGRAAKRLSDLTGREAKTLHRLLGYSPGRGYKNKHFDADILIIDEGSMLEQVMFNHLLQAIDPSTKIVIVGDTDQLPAIGAGDVLREMIASRTVPVVCLKDNFRQKEGSLIAANAAIIKDGGMPHDRPGGDFIMLTEETQPRIHDRLIRLVAEELPAKYGIKAKDIQIVTPQQEGPLGAKQLNIDIQNAVNPVAPGITRGSKIFRLGDRVMQISNSSARKRYNGETGWISSVDEEGQRLVVTFNDEETSVYEKKELGELTLSYATTVHKLQGSETDYMVMPVTMGHKPLLYRNLLYTGVSRAKKLCVLVGEEKAIKTAVENQSPIVRNSNFSHRLRKYLPVLSTHHSE